MKKYGFGTIELLLGLLIVSIITITLLPMLKSVNSGISTDTSVESVQTQIDEKVSDIEKMKKEQENYLRDTLNEE